MTPPGAGRCTRSGRSRGAGRGSSSTARATCGPGTSPSTGASRSPRPSARSWTSRRPLPRCPGRRAGRGAGAQARHARGPPGPRDRQPARARWTRRRRRGRSSSAASARLLREHGLPQPISNGIVEGYEVDLHWPDLRLVAELDGYALPRATGARSRPTASATSSSPPAGWRTVRVTDRQLDRTRAETAERFSAAARSSASLEREHLGDGRDRQLAVEVREGLAGRRRELDPEVVEAGLVDDEHDEIRTRPRSSAPPSRPAATSARSG